MSRTNGEPAVMKQDSALSIALRLGRVSNLPTVWSNTLVGVVLAGGSVLDAHLPLLLTALSLFYVGGMFLNDAFDRDFDARARPERPIPAGQVSAVAVFTAGFGMLAAGVLLLAILGYAFVDGTAWRGPAAGAALSGVIVLYNIWHKNNPLSPVLMGLCRMFVYITAALTVAITVPPALKIAAIVLLCYLIGLTYTAKREHLNDLGSIWPLSALAIPFIYGIALALETPQVWPFVMLLLGCVIYAVRLLHRRARGDVPRAVVSLIAGISLLDAMLLSAVNLTAATVAIAAFALTLALQRWVSGT